MSCACAPATRSPQPAGGDASGASTTVQILAINDFDSDIYATPAVSEGHMYIRTSDAMYAIGAAK